MTDRVPTENIERIVGVRRQQHHIVRLVSEDQRVYILHGLRCFAQVPDLRRYSTSLDDYGLWDRREDPDDEGYVWADDDVAMDALMRDQHEGWLASPAADHLTRSTHG